MIDQRSNLPGAGKPQITPDMLRNSKNVVCECGGMIFTEKLFFKTISAIISPSGKEEVAPMPIIVCENCGGVPSAFDQQNILPKEIKAKALEFTEGVDVSSLMEVSEKGALIKGDLEVEGNIYATEDVKIGTKEDWKTGQYSGKSEEKK